MNKDLSIKKGVAVALSGGIDSLVAAFLLKKSYPTLLGIHFTTQYYTSSNNIESISKQLDIPVYCIDLKDEFETSVVSYFINTYQSGKTPNPCVICNQKVKFGALYKAAQNLGVSFLATGHYAKVEKRELLKGKDSLKEQSYFLSMLSPEQLKQSIFPLGDLTKQEVIAIATNNGLVPIHKKESQDICFIKEESFADFIASKSPLPFSQGDIITTDNKIVGRHKGLYSYTIGQRKGLNCPGPAPYYVKKIDMEHNRLIIGFKEELFQNECSIKNINWLSDKAATDILTSPLRVTTKIRYSHSGASSTLILQNNTKEYNQGGKEQDKYNSLKVMFDEPQLAITPGQCAVFYDGEQVLGAGFIE